VTDRVRALSAAMVAEAKTKPGGWAAGHQLAEGLELGRGAVAAMAADPARFAGVTELGVPERIWRHVSTKPEADGGRGPKELTGVVHLTRDAHGKGQARLLDLVPGRARSGSSGSAKRPVCPC
jgi:hypothetical protein